MCLEARKVKEEIARRAVERQKAGVVSSAIRAELFAEQLAFIDDPSRNKAALCTRRAGKTSIMARYCTMRCPEHPRALIRIWGISRLRSKQLLWQEFLDVAARHKVPIKTHETELTIRFANGSEIRLLGADKDKEAQKKRGDKTLMEVILEPALRPLPAHAGRRRGRALSLRLAGDDVHGGTPGPVPTGFWYWVTGDESAPDTGTWTSKGMTVPTGGKDENGNDEKEMVGAGWSCHRWSLLNNPKIPGGLATLTGSASPPRTW